ncbi:metalloregulator ArsR/SmtB family transcription factor [Aminobacter sp. DSM 101952]|uniref:ArsR/SmtB family transcription factor n=1 Tax=Aminobacter sp. DSM 101952 TaxID=2735891 RepID=UPI000A795FF3|nr:metalloregulator ArsR/SmtB family transcription factor [Aminobacter sp. DSM 101952]
MMEAQQLDRMFTALADAGRRGMVERLSLGPATVKELAGPANMGLPSALKHLRVLEDGGIVVSRKVGRIRTYTMQAAAFAAIDDWVRKRQTAMNQAFDRLIEAMKEIPEEQDRS